MRYIVIILGEVISDYEGVIEPNNAVETVVEIINMFLSKHIFNYVSADLLNTYDKCATQELYCRAEIFPLCVIEQDVIIWKLDQIRSMVNLNNPVTNIPEVIYKNAKNVESARKNYISAIRKVCLHSKKLKEMV